MRGWCVCVYKSWHATGGQGDCGIYLLTTASGGIRRQIPPPPWPLGLRVARVWRAVSPEISVFQLGTCRSRLPTGCVLLSCLPKGAGPSTKPFPPERHPTRTKAPRERVPPQALWKRSGQHEPRRVPGHGAPPIEAVFHQAQAFNEAVFRQALPVLFSRQTCPTLRRTPPPAATAPAHPGSSAPLTARNRAMAHP